MKKLFVKRITIFVVPMIIFSFIAVIAPPTPRQLRSLLFSKIDKYALLQESPSPRVILIGGSNLSFGISSPMIKEQIHINPINLGIDAGLGLLYMLDSTIDHIRPYDIVIVSPEYSQYYGELAFGNQSLLRTVLYVDRKDIRLVKIPTQRVGLSNHPP